jgi:type II secretion system protein N
MLKLNKNRILLVAYIIGLLAFFLYLEFPSDRIKTYVAYQLSRISPQIEVTLDRVAPAFPPGLRLYNVNLYHQEQVWGSLENIRIRPHLFSLLVSRKAFTFCADAYAGKIKGNVEIEINSPLVHMAVNADLSGIRVKDVDAIQKISAHRISGILDARLVFTSHARNRNGTGTLSISNARLELAVPLLNQDHLAFRNVAADVVLKNNSLNIENCRFEGNQLDGGVTGSILLNRDFSRGVLDLDATVRPHHMILAAIKKGLPLVFLKGGKGRDKGFNFKIRGTTDAPEFALN